MKKVEVSVIVSLLTTERDFTRGAYEQAYFNGYSNEVLEYYRGRYFSAQNILDIVLEEIGGDV